MSEKIQNDPGADVDKKEDALNALAQSMETEIFKDSSVLHAFAILTEKLKEKLPTYDTILSDDASGRLVTLVLRQVVNEARERNGLKPAHTYFIVAGRHEQPKITDNIGNFLKSKQKSPGIGKALLVTEYISTGQSISQITTLLEKLKIDFDLATLSQQHPLNPENFEHPIKPIYGVMEGGPGLELYYTEPSNKGVRKGGTDSPHPERLSEVNQKVLAMARRDIKRLADMLKQFI